MSAKPQEILFYLSGGLSNRDSNQSLGGPISNTIILDETSNLFTDLTEDQQYGYTDYRCFYVKNGSNSDFTNVSIYLQNQTVGITALLGIIAQDDIQQFNIASDAGIIGGSFSFTMGNQNAVVNYDSDINQWALNFQDALTSIGFTETIVTGQIYSYQNNIFQVFQIEFLGQSGNRNEEAILPDQNNLITNSGNASLTSSIVKKGSPINTEAIQIPSSTSPPVNVVFQSTSQISPLFLGTFKAGDSAPIWIQRTAATNSPSPAASTVTLSVTISGSS